MTPPLVLITRPLEDARRTLARIGARGYPGLIEPLLDLHWFDGPALDLEGIDGLIFTSANGVRAFIRRSPVRGLPAWCVGAASAAVAAEAGFTAVRSADGDVAALATLIASDAPPGSSLLHVAGNQVAGDLGRRLAAAGFAWRKTVLYEARPASALSPAARSALSEGRIGAVLFFSPRTARTFAKLVLEAGLAPSCGSVEALCLSRACAEGASSVEWAGSLAWRDLRVAARPTEDHLVALLPDRSAATPRG